MGSFDDPVIQYADIVRDKSQYPGNTYYVDSATGVDGAGYGVLPAQPFATIDYAVGQCTANNGDVIRVLPGHAETIATAGAIACDVAGISIIGLGEGAARPMLTFNGVVGASILITAASTKIKNIIGVGGLDGLTNPIHIQAADCEIDVEWRDTSSTVEAVRAILTTAAADRLKVDLKYRGFIAGNACVNAARLVGVDTADINIDFYGVASTAIVEFLTTACHNIKVGGKLYNSGTTDGSKNVVDTQGASTWSAELWDATAGASFSGGSGAALASDDISGVSSKVGTPANTGGTASLAEILGDPSNTSLAARLITIAAELSGAAGIATFPSAAAPANAVSMAEALRYAIEQQLWRLATKAYTFAGDGGVQGVVNLFTVTGDVEIELFGVAKNSFTSGGAATIEVGVSGNTAVLIAQSTATDVLINELWFDATPITTIESINTVTSRRFVVSGGQDIVLTIATADLTAGDCTFYCRWRPLSSDGAVA